MKPIPLSYYRQADVVALARSFIGKFLFTRVGPDQVLTGGMVIETEAYKGAEDKACHAYQHRRTSRTEIMFSEGGVAYVYLCYGMHHLFNIVTNVQDVPEAILIRSIIPTVGLEAMTSRRTKTKAPSNLGKGPAVVCQSLGIDRAHTGIQLDGKEIWLEDRGPIIQDDDIQALPRVGIDYAEEHALLPWRFFYPGPYLPAE